MHHDCPYVLQEAPVFIRLQEYQFLHFKYKELGGEILLNTLSALGAQCVMPMDWSFWIFNVFVAPLSTVWYTATHGQSVCWRAEQFLGFLAQDSTCEESNLSDGSSCCHWWWESVVNIPAMTSSSELGKVLLPAPIFQLACGSMWTPQQT